MSYAQAESIASALNGKDAGVLRYAALHIGNESVVVIYDAATGAELGLL